MRKLPLIMFILPAFISLPGKARPDSPHGADFKISCDVCHSSKGWKLDKTVYSFDHNTTAFPLAGQHEVTDCRSCHPTLVFADAKTNCVDCHTDMHYQTVGFDCERCHTPKSWIVNDITGLHQRTRFPLLGPHYTATCTDCHKDASLLRFQPQGVECIDCHSANYLGTTNPNHVQAGYTTNCIECHSFLSFTWTGAGVNHSFFPLTQGHAITDCNKCHTNGNFANTPTECVACHQQDYNATTNPNHIASDIPTTCADCHTTAPGWKPAEFTIHDAQFFPIYSGKHQGTWNTCTDCHTNPSNYGTFTCIDCHDHLQPDMDDKHSGVGGYTYNSLACYECHPTGSTEGSFNHSASNFPLTGAHVTTPCSDCHSNGFVGTPTECSACHINNFNQSTNPNHSTLGFPTTCATCHTTNPGWKPATFPIHGNYYPLTGAHATIANDCNQCHAGNYSNTPNTCVGCHQENYNNTSNPSHGTLGISTDCAGCHTTSPGWTPALFPVHSNYYPLTGAHATIASDCNQCHAGNYNSTPNTCVGCHQANYNNTSNPSHSTLGISTDCATCHTTSPGWNPALFPQHNDYWVFQGAHVGVSTQCNLCHNGNYNSTPNTCVGCHLSDYNSTNNPPHASAQFPTDCQMCHTQNAWDPSTFDHDGQYFPIYSGKHQGQWNLCSDCHNNPGNYSQFTCTTACHPQTQTNEQHNGVSGYSYNSNACLSCHPNGNALRLKSPKTFDNKKE